MPEDGRPFDGTYYFGVLVEYVMTAALLLAFYYSNGSALLAEGVFRVFGARWWLAHAAYLGVVLLGAAAVLFPLHARRARKLAAALPPAEEDETATTAWLGIYARAVAMDAGFSFAFFYVVYALLRWSPHRWWMVAATVYIVFAVLLPMVMVYWVLPHLYTPVALTDDEITTQVRNAGAAAKIHLQFVGQWTDEDIPENSAVTLSKRARAIYFHRDLIEKLTPDELAAIAAREIGGTLHRHRLLQALAGAACAVGGFGAVHWGVAELLRRGAPSPVEGVRAISAFPLLALLVLAASAIAQPVYRAVHRALVYDADAFAARIAGADPLIRALRKMLDDPPPAPRWVEWLFLHEPSTRHRLESLIREVRAP